MDTIRELCHRKWIDTLVTIKKVYAEFQQKARQPNSHKYADLIFRYSEACSSTLATTYSSGSSGERKVVTTDLHHTCTSSHTGKIWQITIEAINLFPIIHWCRDLAIYKYLYGFRYFCFGTISCWNYGISIARKL